MPDNSQWIERKSSNETPKRRSFFGWKITEKTKDLLDFRYNTQEEIDKLNQEMTITDDLDEIMKKDSIINDINDENNIEEKDEWYFKEKDEKEAEANLEQNLQWIQESTNNDSLTNNEIYEKKSTPIEWKIVENPDTNDNEEKDSEENEKAEDKNIEELTSEETKNIEESHEKVEEENVEEKSEPEHEEITETSEETQPEEIIDNKQENEEAELWDSAKFFDPFELNLEDDEENPDSKNENFDPFGLDDENVEEEDIQDEENPENELKDEEPEDIIETSDESQPEEITEETENNEDKKEEEEIEDKREEKDEEDVSEDNYDTWIINNDENENEEVSEDTTEIIEDENTKSENEENEEDEEIEDENENQDNEDLEVDEPIEEENENELEDETQIENETEIEQENTIENEDEINTDESDADESDADENVQNEIDETNIEEPDENDNEDHQENIKTDEKEEDNEDAININTPIAANLNKKDENEETAKFRKVKKNSATWEVVTEEEIQLEQWQDTSNDEEDEEDQPTDEELFEYEPEFFANDELSQQFLILVQNAREIFKLEHKDWQQDPYFKILWWKSENSILEYLFYLIEENDQPIDLYIKKVETNQESWEENEHLVQFSYNKDKELNIFVDEVILYEKINKSEPDTPGYNDTKAILEKFIFLTDNHYQKLEDEINKQREERQKKRQLQQIFKGF